MTHNILIVRESASKDVRSWNAYAKSADDIDNGNLVSLGAFSTTDGESEVFVAGKPATATLAQLWMAFMSEINVTVDGTKRFKGINVDPQDFYIPATTVFGVFKPQVGDIVTMTADGLAGTKGSNTYVVATDASYKLTWASAAISGLSLKLMGDDYISLSNGAIGTQRIVAYKFRVEAVS